VGGFSILIVDIADIVAAAAADDDDWALELVRVEVGHTNRPCHCAHSAALIPSTPLP
jgi:hypothetical protein